MSSRAPFLTNDGDRNHQARRNKLKTSLVRARNDDNKSRLKTSFPTDNNFNKIETNKANREEKHKLCRERLLESNKTKEIAEVKDELSTSISLNDSSSLDISKEDPESDDLAGLRFCSQENCLDQSGDSDNQCEVRWDCYSPETVKQLRKLRGQYNAEGVKRIVANFNDAHVKPQKPSIVNLLPLRGPGPSTAFKEVSFPHRVANKRPQRATSRKAVQEMILLLQKKIAEKEKGSGGTNLCSAEVSTERHRSGIGAEEDGNNDKNENGSNKAENEDCWSDDDLFQDNSFLIEATQNPEKFMNTSVDVSTAVANHCGEIQHKEKSLSTPQEHNKVSINSCAERESPNSSFIPPSYAPKQRCAANKSSGTSSLVWGNKKTVPQASKASNVVVVKNTSMSNQRTNNGKFQQPNQTTQLQQGAKPVSFSSNPRNSFSSSSKTYNSKFSSSVNKFANQNSSKPLPQNSQQTAEHNSQQHVIQNSQSITHLPPGAKVKTSFRKFSSFQAGDSLQKFKTDKSLCKNQSPSSVLNDSFKRTMSCDSSCSSVALLPNNAASVINYKPANAGPIAPSSRLNSAPSELKTSTAVVAKSGFSMSSNYVVLKQAVEPSKSKVGKAEVVISDAVTDDGFDISLTDDVLQQLLEVDEVFDSQADILATGKPLAQIPSSTTSTSKISPPSAEGINGPNYLSAASRTSMMGLRSSTPVRPFSHRRSLVEPASSTPVKVAKISDKDKKDEAASDSGTELFDSFLNEEMYETQILPFLEKIESETSENNSAPPATSSICPPPVSLLSPSPVKCSPEEIEQKRQAALHRRSLRLSQMNRKTSLR
ncbi:hypothetical protein PoB_003848300 [Plakobranchus ocellatus]|uniref:Uncharacterized protein n=1 Tax=Plakobranchus ocellatus TaxID=259542 RepID=A0AAV4AXB6_9GAST|nr:hypothetical protein PoB_003848300 [Plakobranchus ocellatus]